jgi:very-short-patch-repair endonuclease
VPYVRIAGKRNTDRGWGIAMLAARQHGVVSRGQLRDLGMSDTAIHRAVRDGRLHRVFHGAYAVGHPAIGDRGRLHAAALACGEGATISHRSAAALLKLLDRGPAVIDLIAPPERGRKIGGIRFHRVRPPRPDEIVSADGIPTTGPARTLVDLAGVVGDWTLRSAFERAARGGALDIARVEASMDPGRRGNPALRALLDQWRQAAPIARRGRLKSPLEAKVLPLLVHRDLPAPLLNAPVQLAGARIEVDFLWPDHRFVVEADSRGFHATPTAFERDRRRDRELMRAGYSCLRVTHRQAESEASAVAETIAARLREAKSGRVS